MKAYSVDLRQKIVEVYQNKEESVRSCAQRVKVTRSFVQTLLKQHQQKGNIEPLPHGGGCPPKLALYADLVKELLEEKNDDTLRELSQQIKQRTGISVSNSTLCRFLLATPFNTKKKLSLRHRQKVNEYKANDLVIGKAYKMLKQRT
jgi:transposase